MIDEIIVFENLIFDDQEEVIDYMATKLYKQEKVTIDFVEKILEREKTYPTGIYTGGINVALPHSDYEEVLESTLSIATLKKPVKFSRMDEPKEVIDVSIVIMIAIRNPKYHMDILANISHIIMNQTILEKILSSDQEDMEKIIRKELKK